MSLFFCKNLSTLLVCSFFLLNFKITLSSCCKNEADTEICHPDALSRKGLLPSGEDCIDNFQLSASSGSSSSGGHTHRVTGRSDNKKISHLSWPGMTPWGDQLPAGWLRLCCICISVLLPFSILLLSPSFLKHQSLMNVLYSELHLNLILWRTQPATNLIAIIQNLLINWEKLSLKTQYSI